jgi:ParB family chromosome partitioning protein
METSSQLKQLDIDLIDANPENPRIVFRQNEMDSLLVSIKKYGVQVPVSVYREGGRYRLIDGERRWRVSKKLNLRTIPAIVQEKPTTLGNLLMMFNIHALREQWDLFTVANKLTRVIELLIPQYGREPNEPELSEETGLPRGTIRRCRLLIDLPDRYKSVILEELEKPKPRQKLTEDFFIEMEVALKTVRRNSPFAISGQIDEIRDNLIRKYEQGLIRNIVDFRKVAKLATAPKNVDYSQQDAENALNQIFYDKNAGIDQVFSSTVGALYEEKRLITNLRNVIFQIDSLAVVERSDPEIREALLELKNAIDRVLEDE